MAENDSNLIKPINSLHGIIGSKPVKQREGKKRRQHSDEHEDEPKQQLEEETKQQLEDAIEQQNRNTEHGEKQNDSNSIDYCA